MVNTVVNNNALRYYDEMIAGAYEGDLEKNIDEPINNRFVHGAISLAAEQAENPFHIDESVKHPEEYRQARQLYGQMLLCYRKWRSPAVDRKVNRRRMLEAAKKLCDLLLPNPFVSNPYEELLDPVVGVNEDIESLEKLAEEEYKVTEKNDRATGTYVPVMDRVRMFGVVEKKENEVI